MTKLLLGKMPFISSDKFDNRMIDNLALEVHAFASCILTSFTVDETLLPWYLNLSTSFREPPYSVEMPLFD